MAKYRIGIYQDDYAERPDEYEPWRFVSFNSRHVNFVHPDDIDSDDVLATLSYYEHGLGRWSLRGEGYRDPYGFDSVDVAGAIVKDDDYDKSSSQWRDSLDPSELAEILRGSIDRFTDWWNGEYYVLDVTPLDVLKSAACGGALTGEGMSDVCGGYIGKSDLESALHEQGVDLDHDEIQWVGADQGLGQYLNSLRVSA